MQSAPRSLHALIDQMRGVTTAFGLKEVPSIFDRFDEITGGGIQLHWDIRERARAPSCNGKYASLSGCKKAILCMTHKKGYEGPKTELHRETNGVLIEFPTWRVLSIMPPITETTFKEDRLRDDFSKYTVYPLLDGTTVNLYYAGEWIICTPNAIDARHHTWLGDSTYEAALNQLLNSHPEFSYDRLSKTRCYTLLFKHPDFHPCAFEPPRIHFIQSCNVGAPSLGVTRNDDIGLPKHESVNVTFDEVMKCTRAAITRPKSSESVRYGYVLRAPPKSGLCDLTIEAPLMKYIRYVIYDMPHQQSREIQLHDPDQRVYYFVLRAQMVPAYREHFLSVFPQYGELFNWCDVMFETIANKLIAMHANGGRCDQTAESVAASTLMNILKGENININSSHAKSIIDDFIRDPNRLNVMHACLCIIRTAQRS